MTNNNLSVPLFQGLTEPITIMGAPRTTVFTIWMIGGALSAGLQQWLIGIPLALALHFIARLVTAHDPHFVSSAIRHIRYPQFFDS
ncbi:MAG: VirB3 family type IV secretion system protein [Rhodobiaceae bacterium]|nr:conjugal transfer protein [Rhodobiaceae bacterium]MCR9243297.1 VirB3 family type IV secretion system protein [Rhodobiaceae bacterium]